MSITATTKTLKFRLFIKYRLHTHKHPMLVSLHYCIFETSNLVFRISSSESKTGSVASAIDVGIFSSTHRKSSSSFVVVRDDGFGELLRAPRILTPYASDTNCSSSYSVNNDEIFQGDNCNIDYQKI